MAGRLLGVSPGVVLRWLDLPADRTPATEPIASFDDLVELHIAQRLHRITGRSYTVLRKEIRRTARGRPTIGRRFLVDAASKVYEDTAEGVEELAAQQGQLGLREIIEQIHIDTIEVDETDPDVAARLRLPDGARGRVVIDPERAWGAPVIRDTRITAEQLYDNWRATGGDAEVVARGYGLDVADVEAAVAFEQHRRRHRAAAS